jgi:hypothetical protein
MIYIMFVSIKIFRHLSRPFSSQLLRFFVSSFRFCSISARERLGSWRPRQCSFYVSVLKRVGGVSLIQYVHSAAVDLACTCTNQPRWNIRMAHPSSRRLQICRIPDYINFLAFHSSSLLIRSFIKPFQSIRSFLIPPVGYY